MVGYDEAAGYGPDKYKTAAAAATAQSEAREHVKSMAAAIRAKGYRNMRITAATHHPHEELPAGSRVVHFIRHGQGKHNAVAEESKYKCDCDAPIEGQPRGFCPYCDPELLDPRLTQLGCDQAMRLRETPGLKKPDLVCVSPLVRATETVAIGFPHLWGANPTAVAATPDVHLYDTGNNKPAAPWIALRNLSEASGKHVCDKRRNTSALKAMFPFIDYSRLPEEDDLWTPARETKLQIADRAYDFMCWLRDRPEQEIVVGTHSAFLLTMMNAVLDCQHSCLEAWFATGEMRSVRVTFEDRTLTNPSDTVVEPQSKKSRTE